MADPVVPPTPPASKVSLDDDALEKLATALRAGQQPPPQPQPAPAPPADEEITQEFENLVNSGKAGDALKLLRDRAYAPQQAQLTNLARAMGQQNVAALKLQYGDKFARREKRFREAMAQYRVGEEQLADPNIVHQLWQVTLINDPSYVEEEVDSRLKAKEAEREAERAKQPPTSLSPILPATMSSANDDERKEAETLLDKHVGREALPYLHRQLDAFGVPFDAYIRQLKKADDPESTESIGFGPFRKRIWTQIGGKSRIPAAKK